MIRTCLITQFLFILLLNLGALDVHQGLAVGCHEVEREALLNFKHSLSDPSNRLSSWEGEGCCDWEGVACDNVTAFVTHLHLPNPYCDSGGYYDNSSYLTSSKLNPSLLELSQLRYLDLSCSNFQGSQIPEFIGSFNSLTYLNLSYSNFGGIVPSQLGNITSLRTLDLSSFDEFRCFFTDLHWVSTLVSLQYLDISRSFIYETDNSMHAPTIPPSLLVLHLHDLSRIQHLASSFNILGRTLPSGLTDMTSNPYATFSFLNYFRPFFSPLWLRNMSSLTYLDLSNDAINGSIPLWLGNMTSLKYLDLSNNALSGSIPLWLGDMTSLTYLDLSNNALSGSIPLSMKSMRKLEYLNLSSNSFSSVEGGAIMGLLGNLCKLIDFDLSNNFIGGRIEANHSNSYKCLPYDLENLRLGGNMIGGPLPSWMGDFKNLRVVDISNNLINGHIPVSIESLSYMEYLDLSNNTLNGNVPQGLGQCKSLVHIDLSLNFIYSTLSESHLNKLSRLEILDLSFNEVEWNISSNWSPPFQLSLLHMTSCKIQTQFPRWIVDQTKLDSLDFSDNNISGELPQCFTSNQLTRINISHNQITGPVPSYFSSNKLDTIDLSYNMLSGSVVHQDPSAKNDTVGTPICQLSSLEFLDLQKNNISGGIPDCWAGLDLAYINLSSNNLSGIIPLSLGLLPGLYFLKLSENSLHGPIPQTLSTSSLLQILDLGENKLEGNIPSTSGGRTLPNLVLLRLRGNQLVGSIPATLCDIYTLQFIDLSLNNLTGGIPRCFGNLLLMRSSNVNTLLFFPNYEDDNMKVVLKGAELQYTTTLKYFVNIDLSYNALTGSIPEEITNLLALIGLNLSHNHLTGNIPNKIGEMTSLESLDLSNNNLSGTIPPSISALTSLVRLNLSYNKLQGEIPTGHQLQVIEDPTMTYIGNPGLCGDPLPNKCRTNHGENQPMQGQEKPHKVDVWDKPLLYLVITSGFATGFWGVVGSLVLKRRFRFAFFQLVGNVADYFYVQVMIRVNRLRN